MGRPIRLSGWFDLCAVTGCDESAGWATTAGRVCNRHAVTEHCPVPHPDPAWQRIQRANAISAALYGRAS